MSPTTFQTTLFPRPGIIWMVVTGWIVFATSFLLISSVSMIPTAAPSGHIYSDKLLHAFAYAVLTSGMVFAWPKRSLLLIFILSFGFGAIIEVAQGTLAQGRTASIADALANGLGALAIIMGWILVSPYLKRYLPTRD